MADITLQNHIKRNISHPFCVYSTTLQTQGSTSQNYCHFFEVQPGVWKSRDRIAWGDAAKDYELKKGDKQAVWENAAEKYLS